MADSGIPQDSGTGVAHAPHVTEVAPRPGYKLLVSFDNRCQRLYDLAPLLEHTLFAELKNEELFRGVTVEPGGYAVSWESGADLSEHELWVNGVEPSDIGVG